MFSSHSVDTEIIDKFELVSILSATFKLPEYQVFSLIEKVNPNSLLYKKIAKLIKKIGINKVKKQHEIGRQAIIDAEKNEFDRKLTSMTGTFLKEIEASFQEENINIPTSAIKNIDSFLYLINSNYYDEIKEKNPNLRREFLIEQLLFLITSYLKETSIFSFTEDDAKEILNKCLFIDSNLKTKILEEFISAKSKHRKNISYQIIHKDILGGKDAYLTARDQANHNRVPEWKVDNEYNYITLIEALEVCEDIEELDLGSAEDLCWDLPFIQKMMTFIHTNYKDELLQFNEEYSSFQLTSGFLLYTMAYALEEEIPEVTSDVVLASFAEWPSLPFNLKLKIIDDLFEQENLDYSYHPYRDKKPEHKAYQKKIIILKKEPNDSNL